MRSIVVLWFYSFIFQLVFSNFDHLLLKVIKHQVVNYLPFFVFDHTWERKAQIGVNAVMAFFRNDTHAYPSIATSEPPVLHMVASSIRCTGLAALSGFVNNFVSSVLHSWNELFLQPSLIPNDFRNRFVSNFCKVIVGKLCWRMISPNYQIFYFSYVLTCFRSNSCKSSVMV